MRTAALRVTSGSEFCQIDANCATDGAGAHGNNEACTIHVDVAGTLTATQFDTEHEYDYVTIGEISYHGSTSPSGVAVAAGSNFTWRSDGSVVNAGWTICLAGNEPSRRRIVYYSTVLIWNAAS